MLQIIREESGGVAIDPNGIIPIPGSKCLRTLDVLDLCLLARAPDRVSIGDVVHITYCTIPGQDRKEQKCIRFIFFVGEYGEKRLFGYPEAATLWRLNRYFTGHLQKLLGCDPQAMAEAILRHAPW